MFQNVPSRVCSLFFSQFGSVQYIRHFLTANLTVSFHFSVYASHRFAQHDILVNEFTQVERVFVPRYHAHILVGFFVCIAESDIIFPLEIQRNGHFLQATVACHDYFSFDFEQKHQLPFTLLHREIQKQVCVQNILCFKFFKQLSVYPELVFMNSVRQTCKFHHVFFAHKFKKCTLVYEFAKVRLFFHLNKQKTENCKQPFVNNPALFLEPYIGHRFFAIVALQFQRRLVHHVEVRLYIVFNIGYAVGVDTFHYTANRIRYFKVFLFHYLVILYYNHGCIRSNQSHLVHFRFFKEFVLHFDYTLFAIIMQT